MPRVRCHVHKSQDPNLDLFDLVLFFFFFFLKTPFPMSILPSPHTNTLSCDFIYGKFLSLHILWSVCSDAPFPGTSFTFMLFIISDNRAIAKILIWGAALYESHPQCECVRRPGNIHLIISEPLFPVGDREKSHWAEITRSGQQRGVNNCAVVSEMTEVCSFLRVGRPRMLRFKACNSFWKADMKLKRCVIFYATSLIALDQFCSRIALLWANKAKMCDLTLQRVLC